MIAAVITIGSGPFAVAVALPSVPNGSTPLDGQTATTLKSAQAALDRLGTDIKPAQVRPVETGPIETDPVQSETTHTEVTTVLRAVESSVLANRAASSQAAAADRPPIVVADIPADYLRLYRDAATTCPGLNWSVLAAIGKLESNHGRSTLPGVRSGANSHGAKGPMQFLQRTFDSVVARHPVPPGGATPPSVHNPHDAVHTAASYLCDSGARNNRNPHGAIYAYNHSRAYVSKVLDTARAYGRALPNPAPTRPSPSPSPAPSPAPSASPAPKPAGPRADDRGGFAAQAAVTFARAQIGKPYVWGGNGNPGFDCSGLTKAAYAAAKVSIPRTSQAQYNAGSRLPAGAALQPGDLLFFGTARNIHHVGISLGGTLMIHSPTFGQTVRIQDYRNLRDYVGASRPA